MTLEDAIRAACLLEVTARKPGNVHPLASFSDCDWETFAASADTIAPILAGAVGRPLGETIFRAVEATRVRVGRNTNLGMILLLAPLAALPADENLRRGVARILRETTLDDCQRVYEAIRFARPGGLGTAGVQDVAARPTVTLVEAMGLAAARDDVATQYADGFLNVFSLADGFTAVDLEDLERQIVLAHLHQLAIRSDTLIARKCGPDVAAEAARRARTALQSGGVETVEGSTRLVEFDRWLRADGNRRNPGTTADLIAAALFVAFRERRIPCFTDQSIRDYAEWIRRSGELLPLAAPR